MNINATIIGQFITFFILVWFTMKYVWPPITKAMRDREKKIAAGLEAAERGKRELEMAEHKALTIIREAKQNATRIVEQADLHASKIIEAAKEQAKQEGKRIIELTQDEIAKDVARAKRELKTHLAQLAIQGAEKIIQRTLDASTHHKLLDDLVEQI